MKQTESKPDSRYLRRLLFVVLGVCCVMQFTSVFARGVMDSGDSWRLQNQALHAALEMGGSVLAIVGAYFLLQLDSATAFMR
jgi:hypothetical protein